MNQYNTDIACQYQPETFLAGYGKYSFQLNKISSLIILSLIIYNKTIVSLLNQNDGFFWRFEECE